MSPHEYTLFILESQQNNKFSYTVRLMRTIIEICRFRDNPKNYK